MRETAPMIGLKINIQKTKSLRVNRGNNANFNIRGDEIQDVEKFTYLGSIVSSRTDQDIVARIGGATTAFHILRPIWRSLAVSVKTKLRIFSTNVKSVLLYACETWHVTKASKNRIQTFVNRCLRHISFEFDGKTKLEMKICGREQNNNISTCKSEKGNGAG